MLALKLLLTPIIIGLVSLIGRRWGPAMSGWFVGLPLTSGPIVLFLALDQGTAFASRAAQGTLLGQVSVAGFCLTYSWLSFRVGWLRTVLASCCAFFASTLVLEQFSPPLILTFASVVSFLTLVLKLLPESHHQAIVMPPPRWEMPLRMFVATALVLLLTGLADPLGPRLSGLLTPFPIYASILATFTHHFQGPTTACRLLRGVVTGSFTFAVFFLVIAGMLERWGIAVAFSCALLVALLTHGGSLFLLNLRNS